MNICVVGTGYVGLVTGAVFAELGHRVICVDRIAAKIDALQQGRVPFHEPGLDDLVTRNVGDGRLEFTRDLPEGVRASDVVMIAVGTPAQPDGRTDLSAIEEVALEIGRAMQRYTLIAIKSTVPVGTASSVAARVRDAQRTPIAFNVVSNPEFLREGSAVEDALHPDRIVIGAADSGAGAALAKLYGNFSCPLLVTDLESAEMIKYASNAFLATRISFVNAMANICEAVGADVSQVTNGMGLDRRIGHAFLEAGLGFGGSCFPKDCASLIQTAAASGYDFRLLESVLHINDERPLRLLAKIQKVLAPLETKLIGVLGLAFKPNTDDVRHARSLEVIRGLLDAGCQLKVYDPVAIECVRPLLPPSVRYCRSAWEAAEGTDGLVIATEWDEFKSLPLARLRESMRRPVVFDGRNIWDPERMRRLGFEYYSMGRKAALPEALAASIGELGTRVNGSHAENFPAKLVPQTTPGRGSSNGVAAAAEVREPLGRPRGLEGRPRVGGKFLFAGDDKLYVRGVTYGAFRPDPDGNEYHDLDQIEQDFAQMVANGFNAVRIPHTMPPRHLLDAAQRHGLRVMVGLSAEQYVGYLIDRRGAPNIEELVRAKVRACAGHPAILCYAIGNEIPAPTVRWLGRRRVERYLERLYRIVKAEDPEGLVTYVNYPTTEYLQLPFLDLVCFNVYLESTERLGAYLARLQNMAGDRPLIMSEIGLDSFRHGEDAQARALYSQLRTAFTAGCAGAFIFAWTDEWYRAGAEVDDWAFGITDRQRRPKPALSSVCQAFAEVSRPPQTRWPRVSVVVCSFNGERTIRDCCAGLVRLNYPNFEVIVVDDGSTDRTADIASEYGFRLIRHPENQGLSKARNSGLEAATGEIVAYIDDDAWPDPDWLTYLATTFMNSDFVSVGGPNVPPPDDGPIADCVANAPGNPVHVLLSDGEAEHIPGCNMAFRKACLEEIGGFDSHFRVAGDDVDVCWRLRERGWKIGFNPAAMVWHHRRNSVRAYWTQQRGYGRAEALLEAKWPAKYNSLGHLRWWGRVYDKGTTHALGWWRDRIYRGAWGSAPFQSLYQPAPGVLASLTLMPEWYFAIIGLGALAALGSLWRPVLAALPLLLVAILALLLQAGSTAAKADFSSPPRSAFGRLKMRSLTMVLHLLQPLARLYGRLTYGLTPWRRRGVAKFTLPRPRSWALWTQQWRAAEERLAAIETALKSARARVRRGGAFDNWDLEVKGGLFGGVRLLMSVEDHGAGTQFVRVRSWPLCRSVGPMFIFLLASLTVMSAVDQAWIVCAVLGGLTGVLTIRTLLECGWSAATVLSAVNCGVGAESS